MFKIYSRIAAISFLLWGVIHILGGAVMVFAQGGASGIVEILTQSPLAGEVTSVIDGITKYYAFNLVVLGVCVVALSIEILRSGTPSTYASAILLTGIVDLGLVVFLILPGHLSFADGSPGLILFMTGTLFSILSLSKIRTR